jgi:hypothetical protein
MDAGDALGVQDEGVPATLPGEDGPAAGPELPAGGDEAGAGDAREILVADEYEGGQWPAGAAPRVRESPERQVNIWGTSHLSPRW